MYLFVKTFLYLYKWFTMPKEYYDVSYKTYFNERLKPVRFRGKESYPLYIQVTYDRKTTSFKSYYFELFSRPKYAFLDITMDQIEQLESGVLDYVINRFSDEFSTDKIATRYKIFSQDVLDYMDVPFKKFLGEYFTKKEYPGIGELLQLASEDVCSIRIWDDLKKIIEPRALEYLEYAAVQEGTYLSLAIYIRHAAPKGPFCLPLHLWDDETTQERIENYLDERGPTFLGLNNLRHEISKLTHHPAAYGRNWIRVWP